MVQIGHCEQDHVGPWAKIIRCGVCFYISLIHILR